jgi:hypothetical protein
MFPTHPDLLNSSLLYTAGTYFIIDLRPQALVFFFGKEWIA